MLHPITRLSRCWRTCIRVVHPTAPTLGDSRGVTNNGRCHMTAVVVTSADSTGNAAPCPRPRLQVSPNRCIPFKSAFSQMFWVVAERATRSPAPPPKATRVADDQPSRSLLATHNDVPTGSCDWGRGHAVYVGATRDELDVVDVHGCAGRQHECCRTGLHVKLDGHFGVSNEGIGEVKLHRSGLGHHQRPPRHDPLAAPFQTRGSGT